MERVLIVVALLLIGAFGTVNAQERLAVLSLMGSGVDVSTLETTHMLLVSEIARLQKYALVSRAEIEPLTTERKCSESACAVEIGKQVNAAKIVFGSLNRLGEKVVLQYELVDVASGRTLLSDNLSAMKVEDLDQVVKRVAISIVDQVPVKETVEVGLVTQQESKEVNTRKASSSFGIGWGYLYPQNGYDDREPVFVWDFRSIYEMRHLAVDAVLGFRQGVALNVSILYLPGLKDFTPFAGAGIGFHGVSHERYYGSYDYYYDNEETKADGFELLVKGGLLAFRTFDFRLAATVEYNYVFNDYDDSAIILTLAIMRGGKKVFGIF